MSALAEDLIKIHKFKYTPDEVKTTAILGNTKVAFNQPWISLLRTTQYANMNSGNAKNKK